MKSGSTKPEGVTSALPTGTRKRDLYRENGEAQKGSSLKEEMANHSVFLPEEPQEQYKKAKRYDTRRAPWGGSCPT